MLTDANYGTPPVGWDRRGFLKELGLGGIALASLLHGPDGNRVRSGRTGG